ncbi:MAG: TonB-dependent receptor [Deltaproteobacteria bacterium]|jgi:iron complex outermembrane receptor protein|nr:TonB-dependent receptor [Deltaproteobacteria bacterium]
MTIGQKNVLALKVLFLYLIVLALAPSQLWAQEDAALEAIDIKGVIRREELQTTSATVLKNEDLVNRIYYQPLDMIKQSPGVFVTYYGESGVAPVFNIRGFSAGHNAAADVTMYLDGIPMHDNGHTTGYLDTGMIMPLELEELEIIKGPSSVYYGQHAAGGSLAAQTIKGGNLTRLNVRYGSYNDVNAAGLIAREQGKLAQVYAFEMFHTDGYRAHSEWDKKNFSGRWTYKFTDDFSVMVNLRAYQSEWDSAGYISKIKSKNDQDWVNDGSGEGNGGGRKRYDARLWANYFINDENQLSFYVYGTTLDHFRYQINPNLYPTAGGSGTKQQNTHKSWGVGVTHSFKGELGGKATTTTVGLTYMYEREDPNKRYSLIWGQGHRLNNLTRFDTYSLSNPTIFGEITYQILRQINIRLGGRYDMLEGDYHNHLTNVKQSSPRYKFFSPKVGVLYTPLDWLNFYANFGRGFSTPGLSMDANTGFYSDSPFDLMTRDQYELGTRMEITDWLSAELALFKVFTKNDSTWDEDSATNVPAGKTVRQGLEVSVNVTPVPNWYFKANYALMDAKYKSFQQSSAGSILKLDGYRMPNIPRHIANFELGYAPAEGLSGRLNVRYEAENYFRSAPSVLQNGNPNPTTPYVAKNKDKVFVDMRLSYRFNENYRLSLDVNNLLDKKYYYFSTWPTRPGADYRYAPYNPRTFYLTLEMNWDKKD